MFIPSLMNPSIKNFSSVTAFFISATLCLAENPVVLTTASGTKGADAYVQLGVPGSNFGSVADLAVKYGGNNAGTTNRKVYVRFDISSLAVSSADASLALTVGLNNGGSTNRTPQNFTLNLYGLNDGATAGAGALGEDWDESAITWDNGPANIVSGTGAGNAVKTGAGTANGGEAMLIGSFEVTAAENVGSVIVAASGTNLVDFLNADTDGQVTFIVTRTGWTTGGGTPTPNQGGSNLIFRSKENTTGHQPPTLTITSAAIEGIRIISFVYPSENSGALITWESIIGKSYRIETSADLIDWSVEVVDQWPGAGGATETTLSFEDIEYAGSTPHRYYRVRFQ